MGVLVFFGIILNVVDLVYRLLLIVLFMYIFIMEYLIFNKGNFLRVKCVLIVFMFNVFIIGNNYCIYVFIENLLMIMVNYLFSYFVVILRVD